MSGSIDLKPDSRCARRSEPPLCRSRALTGSTVAPERSGAACWTCWRTHKRNTEARARKARFGERMSRSRVPRPIRARTPRAQEMLLPARALVHFGGKASWNQLVGAFGGLPMRPYRPVHIAGGSPGISHHTLRSGKAIQKGCGTKSALENPFDRIAVRESSRIAGTPSCFWRTTIALAVVPTSP